MESIVHGPRLVVNEEEAMRVRAIFALYLEQQGLRGVVRELELRNWRNKRWQTRKGRPDAYHAPMLKLLCSLRH
jgi:hypothetical protein